MMHGSRHSRGFEQLLSAEDEKAGQGVFTSALLNGLRCDTDADSNGHVNAAEVRGLLARKIPAAAKRMGGMQNPAIILPTGSEQGNRI